MTQMLDLKLNGELFTAHNINWGWNSLNTFKKEGREGRSEIGIAWSFQ
jgi:hypothetical protein